MTKLPQFTTSPECLSGGMCTACRDTGPVGESFRAGMARSGWDLPDDAPAFACPHGKPWGDTAGKPAGGPGTELKKLLAALGFEATPSCRCNAYAATMDAHGVGWCWDNVPTILEWLAEQAEVGGVGFCRPLARALVWLAIANAWLAETAGE